MKFKIGDTLLDNNVFLAPMAGVTDLPFRLLCREQGAGMSVTEMVSAKAILYKNKNTKETHKCFDCPDETSNSSFSKSFVLFCVRVQVCVRVFFRHRQVSD